MARVVPGNDSPAPMKRTQNEGHITKNSLDLHTEPLELTGDRRRNRPIPMLTIKACQSNLKSSCRTVETMTTKDIGGIEKLSNIFKNICNSALYHFIDLSR